MVRYYIYEIGDNNKRGSIFVRDTIIMIIFIMQNNNPNIINNNKKMQKQQPSGLALQDLKTQKYELIITPLQITNKLSSTVCRKKIVIKLGQSIASTHQLFVPIQLIAEVLYSNTTNKYCPVKGIIKIFDCVDEMNQIISCVGSFQADQLLHNKLDKQIIVKNIGSTILKLEVIVKPLSQSHMEQPKLSKLCESISVISSQNIGENSESSSKRGQSEENGLQQSGKLAGIRRVNTLNFNHGVSSNDVYDLKSGINLGFSKQMPNGINPSNKLEAKAKNLKKFHSKQDRIQHYQIKNQKSMEQFKLINTNIDGNSFNKTKLDHIEGNNGQELKKINDQILQLQSKQSNSEDEQHNDSKYLKAPPFFNSLPHNLGLSSSNSQIASRQFLPDPIHSDSIRSISINEDNTEKQTIANMIDSIKISKQPKRHSITVQASKVEEAHSNYKNPLNNSELSNSIASVTSKASSPQLLQQYQLLEIQTLGELLIEERRKNLLYEQKIEKMQLKAIATKQKYMVLLQQWEKWCQFGLDYLQNLYKDHKGHYILDISSQKDRISLKYNTNKESEQALLNFLSLTTENCMMYKTECHQRTNMKTQNSELTFGKHRNITENSQISSPEFEKVIEKIEATYTNNTYLLKKNKEYETQIQQLQTSLSQKQTELSESKQENNRLTVFCDELQQQLSFLQSQITSLSGINSYLKQKDTQMQNIISSKQETIQNLKKKVRQNNNEMDKLEQEMINCKKVADNKDLMLEEMKEELADKDQILESYREVYGEISRNSRNVQLKNKIKSNSSLCVDDLGDD